MTVPVRCLPDLPFDWKVERILRLVSLASYSFCLLYTSRVSEHSAATESLKKTLDEQTARMKAIKRLYDSSAAFQSLKPVYDGLQKIKFEKPRRCV